MLLHGFLEAVWFLLPAGVANMAPVFAARLLPGLDWPVDLGCIVRGQRLFGSHKTWRGLVVGITAAAAVFALQQVVFAQSPAIRAYSVIDYGGQSWLLGAWMGAAALIGDLVKSAFKRRGGIAPGRPWFPFDQIDWLLGLVLLTYPVVGLSALFALEVIGVGLVLHVVAHFLGYLLRLNASAI